MKRFFCFFLFSFQVFCFQLVKWIGFFRAPWITLAGHFPTSFQRNSAMYWNLFRMKGLLWRKCPHLTRSVSHRSISKSNKTKQNSNPCDNESRTLWLTRNDSLFLTAEVYLIRSMLWVTSAFHTRALFNNHRGVRNIAASGVPHPGNCRLDFCIALTIEVFLAVLNKTFFTD